MFKNDVYNRNLVFGLRKSVLILQDVQHIRDRLMKNVKIFLIFVSQIQRDVFKYQIVKNIKINSLVQKMNNKNFVFGMRNIKNVMIPRFVVIFQKLYQHMMNANNN